MHKQFKSINIPIILSILVILVELCLAGAMIFL